MKKNILKNLTLSALIISITFVSSCSKQTESLDEKYLDKVQTIDSTIKTLYDVLSGDKGEPRDWELFKYLFHPKADLIRYAPNKEGVWEVNFMKAEKYINTSGKWIQKVGFRENELDKKIDSFGSLAHVLSFYESYLPSGITEGRQYDSEIPFMRGFNSFQMLHDGNRWWIINNYWTRETSDNPIPDEFISL